MRRHSYPLWVSGAALLFLVECLGTPVMASPIGPGFDLLHTPDGTAALPADALFMGSPAVPLMSRPIPGLGNTDTIVQRRDGLGTFPGTIDVELVALSLQSVAPVDVGSSSFFDVFVTINPLELAGIMPTGSLLPRSVGRMTVNHELPDGGTFDSFFDVFTEITFREIGGPTSFVQIDQQHIEGGGSWSHNPPAGYPEVPEFPGGEFYPGPISHSGPHPQVVPARVPEPATLLLLGIGLVGLATRRRARQT